MPGIFDSPDNHSTFWEEEKSITKEFPELRDREYFVVPRGRVLYAQREGLWLVYMDKTLFGEKSKYLIRKFFDLDEARTIWRTDLHYSTSTEDIDRLLG